MILCVFCDKTFTPNLDKCLCDVCVNEAYSHKPELYARITLIGGSGFVTDLNGVGMAFRNEFSADAEEGHKWTVELITMSRAEYEALPEFAGH